MKKYTAIFAFVFAAQFTSAQYLIIGKDSLSLADFKRDYQYGLEHNGVAKTIETTEDFILLQQFAESKKADTITTFRENMMQKETELRKEFFFPKKVVDPLLQDYVNSNKNEQKVQIFLVETQDGDTHNYEQIYQDVKAGKISMEEAIQKYTKGNPSPIYLKAGSIDSELYNEVKKLSANTYTGLLKKNGFYAFAKSLGTRPSLGYVIFGTISYPNDEKAEETKNKIYSDLKAGKKFEEVAKNYGSSDHEKNSAGLVLGSPTLPEEVYDKLKGQKAGYYTDPILMNGKYFVFNIFQITPYDLNENSRGLFLREMQNSQYARDVEDQMIAYLKSQPGYKEFPLLQQLKKSYQTFDGYKNSSDVLFQYNGVQTSVQTIKDLVADYKDEAAKLTPTEWSEALENLSAQSLMNSYSMDFPNQKAIKQELEQTKRMLYSDYVFSSYLRNEVNQHPEWLTEYYNANKSKYMWGKRANGRVAIIADPALVKDISKEIKNTKKWEALKTKYYGKLNDKNQILVHFEKGDMPEASDVFVKYKVPFTKGVHKTKMDQRDLVIAIDEILEPSPMTQEESKELLKEAVTDQKLKELIAQQRAKTKIIVQPEFVKDLEKNFKK